MHQTASTQEHIIETYRRRARRYHVTARLYYLLGYPSRLTAIQALRLARGDTVVEVVRDPGWRNVSLIQADLAEFEFPTGLDAILATYALSLVPECAEIIARGATALPPGALCGPGPQGPRRRAPPADAARDGNTVRPFGSTEEWTARRPWESIHAAMQDSLADFSWSELFLGMLYLAAGTGHLERPATHPAR